MERLLDEQKQKKKPNSRLLMCMETQSQLNRATCEKIFMRMHVCMIPQLLDSPMTFRKRKRKKMLSTSNKQESLARIIMFQLFSQ